jgi:hypothetical protein
MAQNIKNLLGKIGIFFWVILFCFIMTIVLIAFSYHHIDTETRYQNGVDPKFTEVEKIFQQTLIDLSLPNSSLVVPGKFIKKPEVPLAYQYNTYSTDMSWDEIRRYYMENAPKYGWKFEDKKSNDSHISFSKGELEKNSKYSLEIFKEKEPSKYNINLSWRGDNPLLSN